jgi:hypothetical protein
MRVFLAALLLLPLSGPVAAEVRDVERDGFSLVMTAEAAVPRDRVFAALTRPAEWWDAEHSWSGDIRNMSFDARAGGCWCEALGSGGSVEHGRVVAHDPARGVIVMNSLLGPLLETAQSGQLIWRVEPAENSAASRITWIYRVAVQPTGNPAQDAVFASAVDHVLGQQLARFVAHVSGAAMPQASDF